MRKIEFKGVEYMVPTSWDQITLEKQIQVSRDVIEFKNETTKKIALISGYAGIPVEVIKKSTPQEVGELFKYMKFLSESIPEVHSNEFKFKGETYYTAQNLLEQEFQDFISIETALQNSKDKLYEALPYLMAILCKKKKEDGTLESLDDYDVEARAEEFKQLPISIANGLGVFFLSIRERLHNDYPIIFKGSGGDSDENRRNREYFEATGWYGVAVDLSQGLTDVSKVLKTKCKDALSYYAIKIHKGKLDKDLHDIATKRQKHQAKAKR